MIVSVLGICDLKRADRDPPFALWGLLFQGWANIWIRAGVSVSWKFLPNFVVRNSAFDIRSSALFPYCLESHCRQRAFFILHHQPMRACLEINRDRMLLRRFREKRIIQVPEKPA